MTQFLKNTQNLRFAISRNSSKNCRQRQRNNLFDNAQAMVATRTVKTVAVPDGGRRRADSFQSPGIDAKNRRRRNSICLRRVILSMSLRPARLWTSSRWRQPTRSVNKKSKPTIGMSCATNNADSLRLRLINLCKGNILLSIYS